MSVLIDTNFLVAVASPKDSNHQKARTAIRDLKETRIVPAPVLPELFYMLTKRVNYSTAMNLFGSLQTPAFQIETITLQDMTRMLEIMAEYADNQFDYVDTSIMALAERLNIDDVYTFDRRDFTVFRPRHRNYLRLLP